MLKFIVLFSLFLIPSCEVFSKTSESEERIMAKREFIKEYLRGRTSKNLQARFNAMATLDIARAASICKEINDKRSTP